MFIGWSCLALGCGPEPVSASETGETGETGADEDAPAPAHWLIYNVAVSPEIELRAVDVSQIDEGVIGEPLVLIESDDDHYGWAGGATPWGGYAFTLDDEYWLLGLGLDGQIQVYPGVPEGVPAKVRNPRFSADGSIALFAGEPALPPDAYYWVRYEHGHPVDGGPLGQMSSELTSGTYLVSPDASYGIVYHRENSTTRRWYQFPLNPEPGLAQLLYEDGEGPSVDAVFDQHMFVWSGGGLHMPGELSVVDMSSGVPGEQMPILPATIGPPVWYSASGNTAVWLEYQSPIEYDEWSALWRVDLVDGVPQPPVELTGPDEVVNGVYVSGTRRIGWQPYDVPIGDSTRVRWVDFAGDQLGPIHTIEAANPIRFVSWSPDQRFVSWADGWRGIAALDGPALGEPHYLEQQDTDSQVVWLDDRMLYSTDDGAQLWWVDLDETGPGPSSLLDPSSLGAAQIRPLGRIVGHDIAVLAVQPVVDSDAHVQLLRWDTNGSVEALPIDDVPNSWVIHQLVRN
jgi:hypothetical protein